VQEELLNKERLMVLGQLAAGLAHQIRNPLGAISNGLALVRRQTQSLHNPIVEEALRIAGDEIWEANRIIGDLLEYARIRPAIPALVELRQVVNGALDAEPLPDSINVEIKIEDLTLHVDEKQVRSALSNLIRNAREAMPDGGTLRFTSQLRGDELELAIADSGVGIPKHQAHLLFEPLVTSKPLGMGLGLPTARALIANQGGTLECVAKIEPGACFVLRLPIHPRSEGPDAD
jgi:signal transduction histidine kinase